jgi:hypothetical protein
VDDVTVITADIIRSRQAGAEVRDLPEALSGLNHPLLIAPFSIYRGDEIQGVCRGALELPEIMRRLRSVCRPLRLRIGLGIGGVDSGLESGDPWKMNGEAFVRAREALDSLKKVQRPRTIVRSWDKDIDTVGSALLRVMDAVEERWTTEQWEAIHAYERLGTYELAGKQLGVALQSVEKRCRAANWPAIKQAEEALASLGRMLCRQLRVQMH